METGKAIYKLLKDSTSVGAICADRIYPELAQQDVDAPFIVYTVTDTTPSGTKNATSKLDTARVELYCVSDDYEQSMDLGIAVRTALDRQSGTISGVEVQSIDFDTSDVQFDPDQRVYVLEQTYDVRVQRTGTAQVVSQFPGNTFTVTEVDGDPSGAVNKLVFSNGTVTIDGNTATVASGAGGSLTVQETGGANSNTADTLEFPADSVTHASGKATIDFTQALASAIGNIEEVGDVYFANGLVGDFNQDGQVGSADLLVFLGWFGYEVEDLALTVSRAQAQQDDGDSPIFQSSQHSSAVATVTALENAGQTVEFFEGINVALGRGFVSQYGDDTVSGATVRRTLYISATSFPTSLAQMQVYPLGPYDDQTKAFVQTVVDAYLAGRTGNGSIVVLREEVSSTPDKLLDTYSGAAAAYSVRKLDKDYTGNCMRIRRASDDAETDIGFDSSGDLDTSAISTHGGSSSCFVVTWYDQSGNSNNATQSTPGGQPQIYNGTAVITENGKPAVDFRYRNALPTDSLTFTDTNPKTVFAVGINDDASNVNTEYFMLGGTSTAYSKISFNRTYANDRSAVVNAASGILVEFGTAIDTTQKLVYASNDGTTQEIAVNGATAVTATGTIDDVNMIGGHRGLSYFSLMGKAQEIIIWTTDESSNRTGIESDINGYFSIYT